MSASKQRTGPVRPWTLHVAAPTRADAFGGPPQAKPPLVTQTAQSHGVAAAVPGVGVIQALRGMGTRRTLGLAALTLAAVAAGATWSHYRVRAGLSMAMVDTPAIADSVIPA